MGVRQNQIAIPGLDPERISSMFRELLTINQAALLIGKSDDFIEDLIARGPDNGGITVTYINNKRRVSRTVLITWVLSHQYDESKLKKNQFSNIVK
jgi:hypothetical protein